nr:hypothetical protein [Tanacetum cinerariifolium]
MLLMQAQENRVDLDEEQLLFLAGGQTNTFDDDVNEGQFRIWLRTKTISFMLINVTPSTLIHTFEVQNHDNYLNDMNESHEEHKMQNNVQPNDVVDSDTEYIRIIEAVTKGSDWQSIAPIKVDPISSFNPKQESVATLREIVEADRVDKPLESSLVYARRYTKLSQELLEYVIGTCPKDFNARDKKLASTPFTKKKQVTFKEPCETLTHNTPTHPE